MRPTGEVRNGARYFVYERTPAAAEANQAFQACVNSGDPNALVAFLHRFPYHVDGLLQLSEFCKQTSDYELAAELIERAFYALESAFDPEFQLCSSSSSTSSTSTSSTSATPLTCKLEFAHAENQAFFRTTFRHIHMLSRRGCCRTALECCKMLLSLDDSDPLALVLQLDQYALRSQQYDFLSRFANEFVVAPPASASKSVRERHQQQQRTSTSTTEAPAPATATATATAASATESQRGLLLPNMYYSVALANYHLANDLQEAYDKATEPEQRLELAARVESQRAEADRLLQRALTVFPAVLCPLLDKCNKELHDPATGAPIQLASCAYFMGAYSPPSLARLVTLFVDRCYNMWTEQSINQWLARNVAVILAKHAAGTVYDNRLWRTDCELVLARFPVHGGRDPYAHLRVDDFNDNVAALPADLVQQLNEAGGAPMLDAYDAAPPPVVPAHTTNPLSLFLTTLLPWYAKSSRERARERERIAAHAHPTRNEVPNAPYQGEPEAGAELVARLMELLGVGGGTHDANEDHDDDDDANEHDDDTLPHQE